MLRGVSFVMNQIVFCNRESFRTLPIHLRKSNSGIKIDALLRCTCVSTMRSNNNHQNSWILEPVGRRLQEGPGNCQWQWDWPSWELREGLWLCLGIGGLGWRPNASYRLRQWFSAQMKDVPSGMGERQGEGQDHFWKAAFICSVDWG